MPMVSQADTILRLNRALAGHYRIEGEVGSGGMATVYLAQDLRHDRTVAALAGPRPDPDPAHRTI